MPDNKNPADFDLPPLPKLPPMPGKTAVTESSIPVRKTDIYAGDKQADKYDDILRSPLDDSMEPAHRNIAAPMMADDDFPVMHSHKEKPAEHKESEKPYSEGDMVFMKDGYDPLAPVPEGPSLDSIDPEEERKKVKLAPMTSSKHQAEARFKQELIMGDLLMDMGEGPELNDLSDEYIDPKKNKINLAEQDHLDNNEKKQLMRSVKEDLSRVPENFNARASARMYNQLMEEKNLKTARKGMLVSFVPVILGLVSSFIAFITPLNWGFHLYIGYAAILGAIGAVLLMIRSVHTKIFGQIIYGICLAVYAVPGLILYALDMFGGGTAGADGGVKHMVAAVICIFCNIIALMILGMSESLGVYYKSRLSRKKD